MIDIIKQIFFKLSVFFLIFNIRADTWLIEESGYYQLGYDIIASDTGIKISTSGVNLDLNGHAISGGLNSILIDSGMSNITITNGFIGNAGQSGILIEEACNDIVFTNIRIAACGKDGIEVLGTTTADVHSNIYMAGVFIDHCGLGAAGGSALNWSYVQNSVIRETNVTRCANLTNPISVMNFNHCDQLNCENIVVSNITAPSVVGYDFTSCSGWLCRNLAFADATSLSGNITGFNLDGSNLFIISQGIVGQCTSAGDMIGFNFGNGGEQNTLKECSVVVNKGTTFIGYKCSDPDYPLTPIKQLGFLNCSAIYNQATAGDSTGILVDGADDCGLRESILGFNESLTGTAAGVLFTDTGGKEWSILQNAFVKNVGVDDDHSYGIVLTNTENLLLKNVAYDNGNISDNQMNGVPSGSVTCVDSGNINTITAPWTNVCVAS